MLTPTELTGALVPQCAMFRDTVNPEQEIGDPFDEGQCHLFSPTAGVSD